MTGDLETLAWGDAQLPEDVDALYAQGMAHYRRREWDEAKECFARLRSIAPDRGGVDALLNEVDIFIQLQAMGPSEPGIGAVIAEPEEAQPSLSPVQAGSVTDRARRRRIPWLTAIVVLAVLAVILAVVDPTGAFGSIVNSIVDREGVARAQRLVNQGRAAMNVGNYERAVEAFGGALALAPDREDIEVQHEKAELYYRLDTLCVEADSDAAAGRLGAATDKLDEILKAGDPTHCGAKEKMQEWERSKALEDRFSEAQDSLEQGDWSKAISALEQLQTDAPAFRSAELQETLFHAYVGYGRELMAAAGDSLEVIGQAIQSFDRGLAIFSNAEVALEERELADLYRQSLLFLNQQNWLESVRVLRLIYERRPDYLDGTAASLLCAAYLQLGDAYYGAHDWESAYEQYVSVRGVEGCDDSTKVKAVARETEVYGILYPPTPTPTKTLVPTSTLLPTPTRTASPVATPVQPTRRPSSPTATSVPPTPTPGRE
mgnify:CR=1 FL=1